MRCSASDTSQQDTKTQIELRGHVAETWPQPEGAPASSASVYSPPSPGGVHVVPLAVAFVPVRVGRTRSKKVKVRLSGAGREVDREAGSEAHGGLNAIRWVEYYFCVPP